MEIVERIVACLKSLTGIQDAFVMEAADRFALLDIEIQAEKKAFMGMGKTYNSGIREVLRCPVVVLAITDMDFNWGCQSHMLLKKDDDVVGEEVRDPVRIEELKQQEHVFFLHPNFVIYKDKVNFPADIVEKRCCFELPALTQEQCFTGLNECGNYVFCFPSTPGDVFLKNRYYGAVDEQGTGTVLFGFTECR